MSGAETDALFEHLVTTSRAAIQESQALAVGDGRARLSQDAMEAIAVDAIRVELNRDAESRIRAGRAPLATEQEQTLVRRVTRYVTGLGPVEEFLADEEVEEIYGHYDYVQVDKGGRPFAVFRNVWPSEQAMLQWLADLARNRGLTERQFNAGSPLLVLRLRAGMRLSAVRDVSQRAVFNLRRNTLQRVTLDGLVRNGMVPSHLGALLRVAMASDLMRIVFVGATGAGKTTLARACLDELDPSKNVVIVEDTAEIDMWHRDRHPLFHSFEVREPNSEGEGGIEMAELVKQTLRHRPDWFCVGECRDGDTAAEMLKAMTSGHSSLTTVHAESARGGIAKLALMLALSESQLNLSVAHNLIAEGVDLMCHVVRDPRDGRRYISEIIEVAGFDGNQAVVNQIYRAADTRFGYSRVATFSPPLEDRLSRLGLDLVGFYRACGATHEVVG